MTITSTPKTIDEYMALEWEREVRQSEDGGFVLTVWPLSDFALYGETEEEVLADYQEALRSHLLGYLATGKTIPTGRLNVAISNETRSSWQRPA